MRFSILYIQVCPFTFSFFEALTTTPPLLHHHHHHHHHHGAPPPRYTFGHFLSFRALGHYFRSCSPEQFLFRCLDSLCFQFFRHYQGSPRAWRSLGTNTLHVRCCGRFVLRDWDLPCGGEDGELAGCLHL